MILLARTRFDTTGDVHGIRLDEADRVAHIFCREAACKNDTVRFCGAAGEGPVRAFSSTAILACSCGVEEKCRGGGVRAKFVELEAGSNPESLGPREVFRTLPHHTRRLVAVQLDGVERQSASQCDDRLGGPIYKDADRFHIVLQARNDLPGNRWS